MQNKPLIFSQRILSANYFHRHKSYKITDCDLYIYGSLPKETKVTNYNGNIIIYGNVDSFSTLTTYNGSILVHGKVRHYCNLTSGKGEVDRSINNIEILGAIGNNSNICSIYGYLELCSIGNNSLAIARNAFVKIHGNVGSKTKVMSFYDVEKRQLKSLDSLVYSKFARITIFGDIGQKSTVASNGTILLHGLIDIHTMLYTKSFLHILNPDADISELKITADKGLAR